MKKTILSAAGLLPEKVTIFCERFPVELTEGRSHNEAKALYRRTDYPHSQAA